MAINWTYDGEKTVTFNVSGHLTKAELDVCQKEAEITIQRLNKAKLLVIVTDFSGWVNDDEAWADLSFGEKNDQYIQKMAIVGDLKWKMLAEMFTLKGLRKFPIEYFPPKQDFFAKEWLSKD